MEAKGSTVGHRGGRYLKILAFARDDRAGAQPAWARFALPMLRFRVPPIQNEEGRQRDPDLPGGLLRGLCVLRGEITYPACTDNG